MIRLFYIGETPVLCSPFALLPILFALIAEKPGLLLLNIFALFLHELAHTFTAKAMGYRIRQIELQPLGFVARLYRRIASRKDELAVAAAGPIFSLLAGVLSLFYADMLSNKDGYQVVQQFGKINLFLGMFNMLPALPLDGGRMAESLLLHFSSAKRCKLILLMNAVIISAGCLLAGCYSFTNKNEKTVFFFGIALFFTLSVIREWRWGRGNTADIMLRRIELIGSGNSIPVRFIALHERTPCYEALFMMEHRCYNVFLILNDGLDLISIKSETEVTAGIAEMGQDAVLSMLIKPH